jgi:hypothetical protein
MRLLLAFALVCLGAGAANAVDFSAGQAPLVKGQSSTGQGNVLLEGGESCASALNIGSLPFDDAGYTCDNFDDISLTTCGYGYTSPDVCYSISGVTGITVSLQGSDYDTQVAVFNSAGAELCCNDDYFGLQSYVECCGLSSSDRYCIVVDGFAGSCGNYYIHVAACGGGGCDIVCPAGGFLEGEPDCGTDYYDSYNGGCNSVGFQQICPTDGNHATVCAKSGTYTYFGLSYRDTDWFVVNGNNGNVTVTMDAEFNSQLILIGPPADCSLGVYTYAQGAPCQVIGPLSTYAGTDVPVWVWGGASVFNGVPCGSDYLLEIDNIRCTGTATESTTWGTVKGLYR